MRYIWLKCKDCNEEVEVAVPEDGPLLCPECLSVDSFEDLDEEE